MLGLFNLFSRTRPTTTRSAPRRTARLFLEQLETRDCPALMGMGLVGPPITPPIVVQTPPMMVSPVLTLSLTMNGLKSVTLSGSVMDGNPASLTVTFTGAVNASTQTDNNGNFSLTINADRLGTVQASTTDGMGLVSNTATVTIAVTPPVIMNFSYVNQLGIGGFSGTVIAPDAAGMTVTLQGPPTPFVNGVNVTADANGNFQFIVPIDPSEFGRVTATCTDCWGQVSNVANTII